MLYALAPHLASIWGPLRLFGSHLVLIGLGLVAGALLVGVLIPRFEGVLPRDRGKAKVPEGEKSKDKPTGAGAIMVPAVAAVLLLVLPPSASIYGFMVCLVLAMVTGYLDDGAEVPWSEAKKGALDGVIAVVASAAICGATDAVWVPLYKEPIGLTPWLFVPVGAVVLWGAVNTTNCSDGVDGLAGTLVLISLICLGGFLYVVVGHREVAEYLLLPHQMNGARWAILVFTFVGGLCGYLWHNAHPSRVLMGDAGSRAVGLLLGGAVLATGNPVLIVIVAPMIVINGGSGLFKLLILRACRKCGLSIDRDSAHFCIRILHRVRFPLHDHCRKEWGWSNAQVLMRFALVQTIMVFVMLALVVKLR